MFHVAILTVTMEKHKKGRLTNIQVLHSSNILSLIDKLAI